MLSPEGSSAICVQRFDGSRNSAIHTTYRISLRSSSLREPRYPLLRVVFVSDQQRVLAFLQRLVWLCPLRATTQFSLGVGKKTRNRADNPETGPLRDQPRSPPAQGAALPRKRGTNRFTVCI